MHEPRLGPGVRLEDVGAAINRALSATGTAEMVRNASMARAQFQRRVIRIATIASSIAAVVAVLRLIAKVLAR